MIRWLIFVFLFLIVFANLLPYLQKFGLGRLPGDFRFRVFGKIFTLPFSSSILISVVIFLIARFVH